MTPKTMYLQLPDDSHQFGGWDWERQHDTDIVFHQVPDEVRRWIAQAVAATWGDAEILAIQWQCTTAEIIEPVLPVKAWLDDLEAAHD